MKFCNSLQVEVAAAMIRSSPDPVSPRSERAPTRSTLPCADIGQTAVTPCQPPEKWAEPVVRSE